MVLYKAHKIKKIDPNFDAVKTQASKVVGQLAEKKRWMCDYFQKFVSLQK